MEKWKKRSIELLVSLAFGGREGVAVVPYYPQKTAVGREEKPFFRRTTPERQGISSRRLYSMIAELERERRANPHSLMVLREGEVICECSAEGYSVNMWQISHSMSKTVCGMIVGIMIDENKLSLDRTIVEIFPEIPYRDRKFPTITVEHLLTMTAGVEFGEMGSVSEVKWTEAFFSSIVRSQPGRKFAYNSMNSYILARICERVSGESFGSLAGRLIFAPLGINDYLWEKGPEGTEKAGWGLYLSPESWAKIGQTFLNDGIFMGRRVLPSWWVEASSHKRVNTPDWSGGFDYSYHTWVAKDGKEVLFNGMFGQNLWICKENGIIAVMTGGNNELFQESPALEILRKYLGGRISDELAYRDVRALWKKQECFCRSKSNLIPLKERRILPFPFLLGVSTPFDDSWSRLIGSYRFRKNEVGILPLVIRAMQNNLADSLEEIAFEREGDGLNFCFTEGGVRRKIALGLYGYKTTVVDFSGESYIVSALGRAVTDGRGEVEYRIRLIFSETASTRIISIVRLDNGHIRMTMSETPGGDIVSRLLGKMWEMNRAAAFGIDLLERRIGAGAVAESIKQSFCPTLIGANTSSDDCEMIILREERIRSEGNGGTRVVRAVLDRLLKEAPESMAGEASPPKTKNIMIMLSKLSKGISEKNGEKEN